MVGLSHLPGPPEHDILAPDGDRQCKGEGMSEGGDWLPHSRRTWVNRALIAVLIVALLAGLFLRQWHVVLRYAELL